MKLVTFTYQGVSRVGAVVDNAVVDSLGQADIPHTMLEFLAAAITGVCGRARSIIPAGESPALAR